MKIEFDSIKNLKNVEGRGLSFERVLDFNFESAIVWQDTRNNYSEPRYNSIGYIEQRLHHITFALRNDVMRIINLRKANRREVQMYAKA